MVITGAENIEAFRIRTLRSGLRLESRGMKMSRGRSALAITREMGLHNERTAKAALPVVEKWIADNL